MSENKVLVDMGLATRDIVSMHYYELAEQAEMELNDGCDLYELPQTGETVDKQGFTNPSEPSANIVISEINGYPIKGDLLHPSQDVRSFDPIKISDGEHTLSLYLDNSPYGLETRGFVDGKELETDGSPDPSFYFEYDGMRNFSEHTEKEGSDTVHFIGADTQFAFKATASVRPDEYLYQHSEQLRDAGFDVDKGLNQIYNGVLDPIVPKVNGGEEKTKLPNREDDLFGR